jgi:hypothetical protein
MNPTKNKKVELTHFLKYPAYLLKNTSSNIPTKTPECLSLRIEKLDNLIATSYTDGKILIYNKLKSSLEKVLIPEKKECNIYNDLENEVNSNISTFPAICSIR